MSYDASEPLKRHNKRWRAITILTVVAAAVVAYNASDWSIGIRSHLKWKSEHYFICDSECGNCFKKVAYWQEKKKSPAGTTSECENCGFTNTYTLETLPVPEPNSGRRR